MKSWNDYSKDIPEFPRVEKYTKYICHCYKGGICVKSINVPNSNSMAVQQLRKEYPAIEVEKIVDPLYNTLKDDYNKAYEDAVDSWKSDLYDEASWAGVNDSALDVAYAKAYDDGHSSGFDEVANCFDDLLSFAVEFAEKAGIK